MNAPLVSRPSEHFFFLAGNAGTCYPKLVNKFRQDEEK